MTRRTALGLLLTTAAAAGADPQWRTEKLPDVEFDFRLVRDLDEIERLLGDRLDKEFTLVEVRLRALYGTKVKLDRDSFTLHCFADAGTSAAQSPARIAGASVFAMGGGGTRASSRSQVMTEDTVGIPVGSPNGGPPRRIGGAPSGLGVPVGSGGASSGGGQTQAAEEDQSLRGRLERLELPLDAGDADVSGYLYFQVNPTSKLKNYSLTYDGAYGEFRIAFGK